MKEKTYTKDDLTITWKPDLCIHSGNCVKNLPGVFKPKDKPWIQPANDTVDHIKMAIDKCPSGALSYDNNENQVKMEKITEVKIMKGGPAVVEGEVKVTDQNGEEKTFPRRVSICRCGASSKSPYCDGSHRQQNFE